MINLAKNIVIPKFVKFLTDYFFLLLMVVGIIVNYYFEMKVNRAIKRYTSNQEKIAQYQQHANRMSLLDKRIGYLESNVRQYIISGKAELLQNQQEEITAINREAVRIGENLRPLVTPAMLEAFRRSVKEKTDFEARLVETFQANGTKAVAVLMASPESSHAGEKFNVNLAGLSSRLDEEILALGKIQARDKMDIISLDYAIPHLTSFIFIVIAGFVLFKILQVYRLNRDLSLAVQREQEAQLIKDQFMDNMTHELRSPLNAVLGYASLLMKTDLKKNQEKFVRAIRTSGELLLNVINEVLDYSKIKSGYIHFTSEPFSLHEQFTALTDVVSDKLNQKGLTLKTNIDLAIPRQLKGDSGKLMQVLLNLTFNAIKFTSKGSISVSAVSKSVSPDKVLIRFQVTDTGMGIPPEKLPFIFERFYQVQDGATSKFGGTGLGLSITKQIVTLQGGTIWAESEPGKGTSIIFDLPFQSVQEEAVKATDGLDSEGIQAMSGILPRKQRLPAAMRILVVDDNVLNRELASFMLQDMGVRFKTATSGTEALELLKTETFDAVLMDVQMPVLDGRETTRKIRSTLGLQVPIIALTAFSQEREKKRCIDAGMNAYLSKPFKEKQLLEVLQMFAPAGTEPETLIDIRHLKKIAQDNQEFIDSVILKIAEKLPEDMAQLRKAVEEKDREKVNQLSHDMKTTFAVLGLTETISGPINYLESWDAMQRGQSKAMKMLEIVEATGAEATTQILENFSSGPNSN
jgi:signal transduction histidine kinase/DNA-binding response OmpR family regulator